MINYFITFFLLFCVTVTAQTKVDWTRDIDNLPVIDSRTTNWFRTNNLGATGNLTVSGAGKVITLTPGPAGLEVGKNIYVTGGTGTAEVVPVTATTCTAVVTTSCTVTVTTANTHSGSWQAKTATVGIQEAYNILPTTGYGGGMVRVPGGSHTTYTTIVMDRSFTAICGVGRVATNLLTSYTGGPMFSLPDETQQNMICGMNLEGPGGVTTTFAISAVNQAHLHVKEVSMNYFGQGISVTGNTNSQNSIFEDLLIFGLRGAGAYIDTTIDGGTWNRVWMAGETNSTNSIGWRVKNTVGLRLNGTYTNSIGAGMVVDPDTGVSIAIIHMTDANFEGFASWSSYGIRLSPATGAWVAGITHQGGGIGGFDYGLLMDGVGTTEDVVISNLNIIANDVAGIHVTQGRRVTFRDCTVTANGNNTQPGAAILGGNDIRILGGTYAAAFYVHGVDSQTYGVYVQNATDVTIADVIATPNKAGNPMGPDGTVIDAGGNTRLQIRNVRGFNPQGPAVVTPGASPWTYTAGPTNEVLYFYGGTITTVVKGGANLPGSPVYLAPGQSVTITYSVVPSSVYKDRF